MLGAQVEGISTPRKAGAEISCDNSPLQWYYISEQELEEVLFVQLFDSASLGEESQYSSAAWHASPELGTGVESNVRERIDVRVMVFGK